MRCSRRRIACPSILVNWCFFVAFIFSTLKQHLKESENFLNKIFSLFYILDIYGSFRTFGDFILDFIERK